MDGLRQIAVVTQGDGWHLVGLDAQGHVWFGTTRRTAKGRAVAWALMDEAAEDTASPPAEGPRPPEAGPGAGRWPSRPGA